MDILSEHKNDLNQVGMKIINNKKKWKIKIAQSEKKLKWRHNTKTICNIKY